MNSEDLIDLLHAVLRGEAHPDDLLADIETAVARSPQAATALLAAIEDLYGRGEVHFDLYLRIKDAAAPVLPKRHALASPTHPPKQANTQLSATGASLAGATQLRAAPRGDRTMLRAATRPPPRDTDRAYRSAPRSTRPTQDGAEAAAWVTEQTLEPGAVIKGRFVLEQRLGEGGMGVVFKARDGRKEEARNRDPYVAIKFLSSEFRRHPEAFMALERETSRAQKLAHPNIVAVRDFDRDGTLIYMTMEFLEGEPLDRFIQRHPQGVRFKEAWPFIEGCSRALAYAHEQGVVHADFKPGNVFVIDERHVKVLDFGIARAITHGGIEPAQGTRFDAGSLGALTPAYASPEMLLGEKADPRDDVYALACVTYELMVGRHPFNGATAVKAAHDGMQVKRTPGMSRRQHRALVRGLAFRQSDRAASVEAFLDEIAGPLGARGRSLRQAVLSTVATATVVAAIAGGAAWYTHRNADEQLLRELMNGAKVEAEDARRRTGREPAALDTTERDLLIEQGQEYLQLSAKKFSPALLSEGVSSAYGAFSIALKTDPSSKAAAEGIVEIVRQYEAEAKRLYDAGQYREAAEMAGYGLKIHATRESLENLKRDAEAQLGTEAG